MNSQKLYLTSPVFKEMSKNRSVSKKRRKKIAALFDQLEIVADVIESQVRFPDSKTMESIVKHHGINLIGCHLSHRIVKPILEHPTVKAVCTATAGYNHIDQIPGVIITHTPSVLQNAVADFTLALILSCFKNIPALNGLVWNNQWGRDQKWDMDAFLGKSISSMTMGIIGLGQIGQELASRLSPWGMKILYYSKTEKPDIEKRFQTLEYSSSLEQVFKESDVVSLHVPLDKSTKHLAGEDLLKLMKPGALLVNTSRGEVVDFKALLRLLESGKISINLAFDVFDPEPIPEPVLAQFKAIAQKSPELQFIFMPHTASSDADTRAEMTIMMLEDLILLAAAGNADDISKVHMIPEQKTLLKEGESAGIRLFSQDIS